MPSIKQLKLKEIDIVYWLCMSALCIFFISDACNKLLFYLHYDFYRVSIFFRSIYEILFFLVIILFLNRVRLMFLKIFFFFFTLFIFGQILFSSNLFYKYNFIENIFIFNKYYFVFIIYFSIYKLQNHADKFQRIIKLLENIFLLNSAAVIIGFLFQINFLRSYLEQSYRYGYSGFIPAQNEATYFFFVAISYFYYKHFILNLRSQRFLLVVLSSFLLGTKGIYLFLCMLLIFHFLNHSSVKSKRITFIGALFLFLGSLWYLETDYAKVLLGYFISKGDSVGWFNMVMSGRNTLITTKGAEVIDNWSIINYFIGGQDQTTFLIEMDFFDLFFFLGIIGGFMYLAFYFFTLFKFRISKPFNFFFVFSFFLLAFLGGHFFSSAINALYICLISLFLYSTQCPAAISYTSG